MSNEDIAHRYLIAVATFDYATQEALRHPDWVWEWPQSGERITTSEDARAIGEHYPGGHFESVERRTVGSADEYVVTPSGTLMKIAGAGDVWTSEWLSRYPDGETWFTIDIVLLRDGRVVRETTYWALPFAPPEWRRQWVQLEQPAQPDPTRP
jgi:ketosteroid isomerase-like protein